MKWGGLEGARTPLVIGLSKRGGSQAPSVTLLPIEIWAVVTRRDVLSWMLYLLQRNWSSGCLVSALSVQQMDKAEIRGDVLFVVPRRTVKL